MQFSGFYRTHADLSIMSKKSQRKSEGKASAPKTETEMLQELMQGAKCKTVRILVFKPINTAHQAFASPAKNRPESRNALVRPWTHAEETDR